MHHSNSQTNFFQVPSSETPPSPPISEKSQSSLNSTQTSSDKKLQLSDVYEFEKRLKNFIEECNSAKKSGYIFLGITILVNIFSIYYFLGCCVSCHGLFQCYSPVLIGGLLIIFYFMNGSYHHQIYYSSKFIDKINDVLQTFNIRFSKKPGKLFLLNKKKQKAIPTSIN